MPKKPLALIQDQPLTVDSLKEAMPKRQKHNITPEFVDTLNDICDHPEEKEAFRQNLIGWCSVLEDQNFRLPDYINAVRYVSYQAMGCTNQKAWVKTFPERYQRLVDLGKVTDEDNMTLRGTVSVYNKGKIVNAVRQQSIIPTWILNNDVQQQAINRLAHLMMSAKSEMAQVNAATTLLTHLKMPETVTMQLDVQVKEDDSIQQLRGALSELALKQREAIELGITNAKETAEAKIIDVDYEKMDYDH